MSFTAPVTYPKHRSEWVNYSLKPQNAKFFIHVPDGYSPKQKFGLIVYISSADKDDTVPEGWEAILKQRKLIYICPQDAGNNCGVYTRAGLALLAALEIIQSHNIDRKRVFLAGVSGGARQASALAFYQSDVFHGTIQSCGSDFYKDVKRCDATTDKDIFGNHYGLCHPTAAEVNAARKNQKFVLITGSGDFRRGNILDIYNGGFAAENFHCKLFDVTGMGHRDCGPGELQQALNFIEKK